LTAIVAAAIIMFSASTATADNYGGVSAATEQQMKTLIYKHFGSGWRGQTMVCIARRESGLNPRAANYTDSNGGSYGLFQINGVHRWRGESLQAFRYRMWNPVANVKQAVRLARGGLGPWGGGC
jgi:hypothetical protein